jgi:hypothetical protein
MSSFTEGRNINYSLNAKFFFGTAMRVLPKINFWWNRVKHKTFHVLRGPRIRFTLQPFVRESIEIKSHSGVKWVHFLAKWLWHHDQSIHIFYPLTTNDL